MGRNSIMDAFNEAARFHNQTIGYATAEMREANEFEVRKNDYDVQMHIKDWIRDNPYVGGANEEDDKLAYQNYLFRMKNEAIDKFYGEASEKNASNFYKEQLKQRRQLAYSIYTNEVLETADNHRIKRERNNLEEDSKRYMDMVKSGDWTPQQALEAAYNRIEFSRTKVEITPEQYNKMRNAAETGVYQIFSQNTFDNLHDVNDFDRAMGEIREAFKHMEPVKINVYDKEDLEDGTTKYNERTEERPWADSHDEWIDVLKDKATERICGERFAKYSDWEARIQRMIIAGDIAGAIREARAGRKEWDRYYNPNNREFVNSNDKFRRQGDGFFKAGEMEGYQNQGEIGELVLRLDYTLDMFVQPQMPGGDGNVIVGYDSKTKEPIMADYQTLQNAKEGFLYYKKAAFMHDKKAKGVLDYVAMTEWEIEKNEFMNTYYEKIRTSLKNVAPNSLAVFDKFRQTDTYLNDKNNELYGDEIKKIKDPHLRDLYAQRCINFFESIFFNGITDEATIKQMMRDFTGSEIMRHLQEQKTSHADPKKQYEQMKAFSDKAKSGQAEHILFVKYNQNRLDVNGKTEIESFVFRSKPQEDAIKSFANEDLKQLSSLLGIKIDDMKPQWMPSDKIENDVIPKAMFIVGEGKDAQAYHLEYQNGNYVAMRREGNKWVEDKAVGRQLNQTEQGQQRVREIKENITIINSGKDPVIGRNIDRNRTLSNPPPGNYMSATDWRIETSNFPEVAENQWAQYYLELKKSPAVTVEKAVNSGKDPFDGKQIDFGNKPVPGYNGSDYSWKDKKHEDKLRLWSDHFIQQIVNNGK